MSTSDLISNRLTNYAKMLLDSEAEELSSASYDLQKGMTATRTPMKLLSILAME